jgi:hypothetical protein
VSWGERHTPGVARQLEQWRSCAEQLAAALEELIDSNHLGDAAKSVKANSRALARFRQLQGAR